MALSVPVSTESKNAQTHSCIPGHPQRQLRGDAAAGSGPKTGDGRSYIKDLQAKGLLDQTLVVLGKGLLGQTLVVLGGEFGRTPRSSDNHRSDDHETFSCLLAEAGIRGGEAVVEQAG
jgi:hypothetical protein